MKNDERPIGFRPFDCLTKNMSFWTDLKPKEGSTEPIEELIVMDPVEGIPDMF